MKAVLWMIFSLNIVIPSMGGASTGEIENAFREGNASFQQGDYDFAIQVYEGLLVDGYISAPLFYNLGNAYYRKGEIARAILNYERARRLSPNDEDILFNLEVARQMTVDRIDTVPRLFLWEYWDFLRDYGSVSTLTWVGYTAYLLVLTAIYLLFLTRKMETRRLAATVGTGAVAVLLLSVFLLISKVSTLKSSDYAIVLADIANVKSAPDSAGADAFVLHGGTRVKISDRVGEWIQIRLDDGKVGWMTKDKVEVI